METRLGLTCLTYRFFTSTRLVMGLLCLPISGCSFIEVYYKPSAEAIRKHMESIASLEDRSAAKILINSLELRIQKTVTSEGFRVKLLSTFDPSKIMKNLGENSEFSSLDIERLSSEIKNLDECDYFDEDNWNCGDRERFRNDLVMKGGHLYLRGMLLEKNFRFILQK